MKHPCDIGVQMKFVDWLNFLQRHRNHAVINLYTPTPVIFKFTIDIDKPFKRLKYDTRIHTNNK